MKPKPTHSQGHRLEQGEAEFKRPGQVCTLTCVHSDLTPASSQVSSGSCFRLCLSDALPVLTGSGATRGAAKRGSPRASEHTQETAHTHSVLRRPENRNRIPHSHTGHPRRSALSGPRVSTRDRGGGPTTPRYRGAPALRGRGLALPTSPLQHGRPSTFTGNAGHSDRSVSSQHQEHAREHSKPHRAGAS